MDYWLINVDGYSLPPTWPAKHTHMCRPTNVTTHANRWRRVCAGDYYSADNQGKDRNRTEIFHLVMVVCEVRTDNAASKVANGIAQVEDGPYLHMPLFHQQTFPVIALNHDISSTVDLEYEVGGECC